MNRLPLKIPCLLLLLLPLMAMAYVGAPLTKLQEKGIILSVKPGLHNQPITLSASVPAGIRLMITTDGNIPSSEQSFDQPIVLSQTTAVSIALTENGKRSDTLYCGTYLINFSSTLPITTIIVPPADLFDPARGIYVGGLTESGKRWGNCWGSQERQAFFELIKEGEAVLAQGVGLRIFGGMTRQNAEKSLRVIARKKYGKGKFKHRVFPNKDIEAFDNLVLRTSGNDWMSTRFKDMMISSLAEDMNIDHLAYQPSVLFVNGEYWGIHNLREKINMSYLEENHGAEPEQTNLIPGLGTTASHGTIAGYNELFNFLSTHSPNMTGFIDSVEKRMDIDNYFKYLCLQIHIRNVDSRGNVRYWQAKNLDNRFRWIYYDGDLGFGAVTQDYLKARLSPTQTEWHNPPVTTFLLRHLTANPQLRDRFISQYCFLLSTWLHADTIGQRVNYFKSWLEPEIERHLNRKTFSQSKSSWLNRVKNLINFAAARMPLAYEHIKSNFNLGSRYQLTVDHPLSTDKFQYTIERIPIPSHPYRGLFFKDARVTVGIGFIHPRYRFVSWEDGSTLRDRILLNPKDSLVRIAAKVEAIPASGRKGNLWINSIGHGKKDQPRFIEINGWNPRTDSLWLVDARKLFSLFIPPTTLPLIVTEDTLAFRKLFPTAKASLIQQPSLRIKQLGQTLYLLEPSGAWIDSVDLLTWDSTNRKKPYWVRNEDGKLETTKKASPFTLASKPWYQHPMFLAVLGTLLLVIAGWIIRRKKNKPGAMIPAVLLVLLMNVSATVKAQRDTSVKYRRVNIETLRQSPMLYKGPNQIESQTDYYRVYQPVSQPLIWVEPFQENEVAKGNWHQSYTVQAFKELASDNFSMRHMKFASRSAQCWITGVKKDFFLIDTVKRLYLARIEHRNGLESWYYPLINPNLKADERTPGSILGATGGFYFWQLRSRSCSILASAIVQSDGLPDPKGFVLENLCPTITDPAARVKNFSKALFQKITEQGLNTNWEKALEEELNKKQ